MCVDSVQVLVCVRVCDNAVFSQVSQSDLGNVRDG